MEAYIYDKYGSATALPALLSWSICHGLGEPCDCFELCFIYDKKLFSALNSAIRMKAFHKGETVFFGVVDEYGITADEGGCTVRMTGRSLAALLLDNESQACQYVSLSLPTVLRNHIYPWGIADVRTQGMNSLYYFAVASGESEWSVLRRFCSFAGNLCPRFSKEGTLILRKGNGAERIIDKFTRIEYTDNRYGVISEILVKNKVTGSSSVVRNDNYVNRGHSCRRVINVTKFIRPDAARYTGRHQINRSKENKHCIKITCPELFAAFPGDFVTIKNDPICYDGRYKVSQSRCFADHNGFGTTLTLDLEL